MRITAVIPTIPGRETMLADALASIHAQTLAAEQVIVERDEKREGAAATRNRGLAKVQTEWVAFLDDDDVWHPDHLERLTATQQETGADLVYPWYDGINATGILTTIRDGNHVDPYGVPFGPEQAQHLLTTANFIPVTVLARTRLLTDAGGFTPPPWADASNPCEDWGCWVRLLQAGATFAHCPHRTWTWRGHAGHTSGRGLVTA